MKIAMISCAVVACLSLPAFAAKVETAQRIVTQPHLLVITADVEPDTLPGVIAWAATAAPY